MRMHFFRSIPLSSNYFQLNFPLYNCYKSSNYTCITAKFIQAMKRTIPALSNSKQNKNTNNSNRNKSPQRVANGVKLYNFSEIDSYRHINKPYLNDVKKEHIKNKLDLEKSTEIRVEKRLKRNELFVPYTLNPFAIYKQHSKSQTIMQTGEQDRTLNQTKNIVDEINNLSKRKLDRQVESRQFDQIRNKAKNVSILVQRQLKNATPSKISFPQKNKSMIALVSKPSLSVVQKIDDQMDFDDIIAMKQGKYFDKNEKDLNIFKLLYDKNFFNKNLTLLDKFFFSFNSIFEKFQKYKVPIYRDISRESRSNALKKPEGKLAENFQAFSQNQLKFTDLMNVAAGRFTPESVYSQMHMDRPNDNANNSEIDDDDVVYNDNTLNRSMMAENYNQSIKEIEEFLKLALTKKETQYQKLNVFRKQEIAKKLEKISRLVNLSIYDKNMHKQLRNQINKEMELFADQNYKYPKTLLEKDSLVRLNKQHKSKNEIIKLTQLIETFQLTKSHDRKVKQLINKRI